MRGKSTAVVMLLSCGLTGLGLSSGVAHARPHCYETGPGYEKCVVDGDYFNPIYEGPKLDRGPIFVPSAPLPPVSVPAPVYVPPPVSTSPGLCPPGSYVDPNNLSVCLPASAGNDFVALAASMSNPALATFGTATTQADADAIAIAQCVAGTNSACVVTARAFHACAAFGLDTAGNVVNGVGPDLGTATAAAGNAASGGQVFAAYCADPPGN